MKLFRLLALCPVVAFGLCLAGCAPADAGDLIVCRHPDVDFGEPGWLQNECRTLREWVNLLKPDDIAPGSHCDHLSPQDDE